MFCLYYDKTKQFIQSHARSFSNEQQYSICLVGTASVCTSALLSEDLGFCSDTSVHHPVTRMQPLALTPPAQPSLLHWLEPSGHWTQEDGVEPCTSGPPHSFKISGFI